MCNRCKGQLFQPEVKIIKVETKQSVIVCAASLVVNALRVQNIMNPNNSLLSRGVHCSVQLIAYEKLSYIYQPLLSKSELKAVFNCSTGQTQGLPHPLVKDRASWAETEY